MKKSIEKFEANIVKSKKSLEERLKHVEDLKDMIKTQKEGLGKKELKKVLKTAEKHVDELEKHIKRGQ